MELKRKFGFWGVFCIAAGAMISSGLFVLPGLAFAQAGPGVILSYALAGVLMLPAMMAKAELATAMPRSGGTYFFIERSMGSLPGMLAGLASWLSIALKSAFALIGIGALVYLLRPEIGEWGIKGIAIGGCVLFCLLNVLSVKGVERLQIALVAALLAILAAFVLFGATRAHHARYAGFLSRGAGNIFATAGLVFVSFGGLTKVASVAGEVRRPGRNLPAGMFAAAGVVSVLYVAAVFVTVGVLNAGMLSGNLAPLSQAGGALLGPAGIAVLSVAALLAFVTTVNSGILAASRIPMAMSRDGLLPTTMHRLSARYGTPWVSILVTGAFMVTVIAALSIVDLVKAASTMMLMLFALVNLAVLIMRRSKIQNYRPLYRAPLYPWLQIFGIIAYGFLIVEMGAAPLLLTAAFACVGALWYVVYLRARGGRESALVYMVKSIVSRKIYRSELEDELKHIAMERDDVIQDRFDRLVSDCTVLDIDGSVMADEMFRQAAAALAPRLKMAESQLVEMFRERERQSSTVIQPGLAIPHIIVEGAGLFEILLVRCKGGVLFPPAGDAVRVAFVLVGSPDERNYHLRALMHIAHIVQERDFTRRWLNAPQAEHLRDIVLLSKRKREQRQERPD